VPDARETLEAEGRFWFRGALNNGEAAALEVLFEPGAPGVRVSSKHLPRDILRPLDSIAQGLLPGAHPVRIVAFDKSEASNWALPWHQDRVVALRERVESRGFSNWTHKAGAWHAEPPVELLERMLFLRVHIDAAATNNGCLELALASHKRIVAAPNASGVAAACPIEQCIAERGDVLAAKALILHRSGASATPSARRAIRIDYSADKLPAPLQWEFEP
jgi:hypothetical protein